MAFFSCHLAPRGVVESHISSLVKCKPIWKMTRWSRTLNPQQCLSFPGTVTGTGVPAATPVSASGFHACGVILGSCVEGMVKPRNSCCWLTQCSKALRNSPMVLPPPPPPPLPKKTSKINLKGSKLQLSWRYTETMPGYQLRQCSL